MSLYTEWRNLSDNHESQEAEVKFWEAYLQAEASIYNELLNNKQEVIEGKGTSESPFKGILPPA